MTNQEQELVVIETIIELMEAQQRKDPTLKKSCALFVQEVTEEIVDVPADNVPKLIRHLNRLGVIENPEYKPDLFLCYFEKLEARKHELLEKIRNEKIGENNFLQNEKGDKNCLKSIHLVTNSLEPSSVIFLVLNELFEMPIRCVVCNNRGEIAYTKKLYDIAYFVDAPNKKVSYSKILADNINNGLFKRRRIAKYMRTNKFKKPTLVQKSEDGKSLVLKNEIPVKTVLIKNIPLQHQSLYKDKTK